MYIARRTGGGRGVYEIAGATATGLTSADLLGREIVFDFSPDLRLPSGVVLDEQGGKHRLRLATADIQIQRQLAAVLMMPSPRRVNDKGSSSQLLTNKAYVIERIDLDFTNHLLAQSASVVASRIGLRSLGQESSLLIPQRLAVLKEVWDRSSLLPQPLQTLVRQHEALVRVGLPISIDCEQVVSSIQREVNLAWPDAAQEAGDPLPALALYVDVDFEMNEPSSDEDQGLVADLLGVAGVPQRVRRAIIQRRGQRPFRQGLLAAYDYRCQVTQYTGEPALEAAHIYPYSEGGDHTNDLRNGLLLRADIHTLFDLGLIKVAPCTLKVRVMDPLAGTNYAALDGTVLRTSAALYPSNDALAYKWAQPWA